LEMTHILVVDDLPEKRLAYEAAPFFTERTPAHIEP